MADKEFVLFWSGKQGGDDLIRLGVEPSAPPWAIHLLQISYQMMYSLIAISKEGDAEPRVLAKGLYEVMGVVIRAD